VLLEEVLAMTHEGVTTQQANRTMSRRTFMQAAAAVAAITAMASEAFARNFGPEAELVRYPDPDIVVLDKRFARCFAPWRNDI
jgi:TAT (twin-arginine translocation) pathway signal sequence